MKIIGITGKSGSGKSTLTEILSKELKCNKVNVDKIGHKATENKENAQKLRDRFGEEIFTQQGTIDRKKLGNIVFSNQDKMDQLTQITWNYMQQELDEIIKNETGEYIILEWALLPISKYWDNCDIKILMKASEEQRKRRVIERDNITEEYFFKRDKNSIDYEKYKFNFIVKNDYREETLEKIANLIK